MGFSWSESISQYGTNVKSSHISELQTNIGTARTKVGLAAYSWARTPTQYADQPTSDDFTECRTAIDQVDSKHCSGHYLTHYSTNLTGHYSSNNAGNYAYCSSHLTAYYAGNYAFCSTHYVSVNSYCGTHSK